MRGGSTRDRRKALLETERSLWQKGFHLVAGVDEAGVGPLAGPVVAAAVILAPDRIPDGIDDSKKLDAPTRLRLAQEIRAAAHAVGLGLCEVVDIDRLNIYQASLLAMRRAVNKLSLRPDHLLIDARRLPELEVSQTSLIRGDSRSVSIAAASIIAKTERDRIMEELDDRYPQYGFRRHKGYPTALHRAALKRHGPCPVHRSSFPSVFEFAGIGAPEYLALLEKIESIRGVEDLRLAEAQLRQSRSSLEAAQYRRLCGLLRKSRRSLGDGQRLLPGFSGEV